MKRSAPPKRRTPLKRGKPPRAKKPLSRSGKRLVRQALPRGRGTPKRLSKLRDKSYLSWIGGLPCGAPKGSHHGPVDAAHVKSRGAGGADFGNLIPLCRWHHARQHEVGIQTFAELHWGSVDELRRIAAEVYPAQYLKARELGWTPDAVGF